MTLDKTGDFLIIADAGHCCVRRLQLSTGKVSTVAGNGQDGFLDGTAAKFSCPIGLTLTTANAIMVADTYNHRIRKIAVNGTVSTITGGEKGYVDGKYDRALFRRPQDIVFDSDGNLIVADTGNHRIRRVTPEGVVSTIAGSVAPGFADGRGPLAFFNEPSAVAVDAANNILVADTNNHAIRKITPDGIVTTVAGNGRPGVLDGDCSVVQFNCPRSLAVVSSSDAMSCHVFVADALNHCVRIIPSVGVGKRGMPMSAPIHTIVSTKQPSTASAAVAAPALQSKESNNHSQPSASVSIKTPSVPVAAPAAGRKEKTTA